MAFVILPTREAVSQALKGKGGSKPTRDANLPVRKAADVLERSNVDYLDATPALAQIPTEEAFFLFDGHLTPKGTHKWPKPFWSTSHLSVMPRMERLYRRVFSRRQVKDTSAYDYIKYIQLDKRRNALGLVVILF